MGFKGNLSWVLRPASGTVSVRKGYAIGNKWFQSCHGLTMKVYVYTELAATRLRLFHHWPQAGGAGSTLNTNIFHNRAEW